MEDKTIGEIRQMPDDNEGNSRTLNQLGDGIILEMTDGRLGITIDPKNLNPEKFKRLAR